MSFFTERDWFVHATASPDSAERLPRPAQGPGVEPVGGAGEPAGHVPIEGLEGHPELREAVGEVPDRVAQLGQHGLHATQMEAAELLGVQCRALRGHRQFPDETPVGIEHHLLESVRELIPLPEPKESKNCLRVCIVNTRRRYD